METVGKKSSEKRLLRIAFIILRSPDLREHLLPSAELAVTYEGQFLISHRSAGAAGLVRGGAALNLFSPS